MLTAMSSLSVPLATSVRATPAVGGVARAAPAATATRVTMPTPSAACRNGRSIQAEKRLLMLIPDLPFPFSAGAPARRARRPPDGTVGKPTCGSPASAHCAHAVDRLVQPHRPGGAQEDGVAEGEDPAVGGH